jgi:predicted nucleic acid-binding protein
MRIFLDANIILDTLDDLRPYHLSSLNLYRYILSNKFELFTSCDIITTVYYVNSKKDKKKALLNIKDTNKILKVIEFSNREIEDTCNLMLEDCDYKDLEDTIQYIMAHKYNCDMIISNDKNFVSKDINLMTSEQFCQEFGVNT